jgi:hypothetical protein
MTRTPFILKRKIFKNNFLKYDKCDDFSFIFKKVFNYFFR